ncbi:MAG: OmpA family protein [Terriglobales bacterium]
MTNFCNHCGAPLAATDKFCIKCGAQRSVAADASTALVCRQCGGALQPNAKFCILCGTPAAAAGASTFTGGPSSVSPAAGAPSTVSAAPATGKPGNLLVKLLLAALGVVLVIGLVIAIGVMYVGYRVKKKVEQVEQSYKHNPAGHAVQPSRSGSASTPPGTRSAPAHQGPPQVTGSESERTVGGPEADLLVRTGDINNLGFGWPEGFDPFSGESTPMHPYPWTPPPPSPPGTDRILFGSGVSEGDLNHGRDGYSGILERHYAPDAPPSQARLDSMPTPITLAVGALPAKIDAVLLQIFVDDFQAPTFHSRYQASLNGTRIPQLEEVINALDQTGPIGKLISVRLLPEYWPLLQSGTVKLLIDDPTTHVPDGYAIDFVRILVNPHSFKYQVSLQCSVVDADKGTPIAGATVSSAVTSATTDQAGHCALEGLPAGMVVASASAPGYDSNSVSVDLVAGQSGRADFRLHAHEESTAALERSIKETGTATIYGIHFDTGSAKLRPDSAPALAAILGLVKDHPGSRWIIAGHTDNQGRADSNQKLSEARAASVVAWLSAHDVATSQLEPQGFGASRPVADNATANGRALNRRVEVAPAK